MSRSRDASQMGKHLERARRDLAGVRVDRFIPGSDVIEGYVLGLGRKWVLLARLGDAWLDGYTLLRLEDVARVRPHPSGDFHSRLLTGRGQWPPRTPVEMDLDTTDGVLRAAAKAAPLLSLHIERDDPDVCFIGATVRIADKAVWLREISTQAEWDGALSRWRYADITRVEIGGRYESALYEVAGPPPQDDEPRQDDDSPQDEDAADDRP